MSVVSDFDNFGNEIENILDKSSIASGIGRIALYVIEQIEREAPNYEGGITSEHDLKHIELQIQAKRVKNILNLCIEKIELGFCLPLIIQDADPDLIYRNCSIDEREKLLTKLKNIFDDIKFKEIDDGPPIIQPDLSYCIDFFYRNGIYELTNKYRNNLSISGQNALFLLHELKQWAEHTILTTSSKDMAKQKVLHRIWAENDNNIREIRKTRKEIEDAENQFGIAISSIQDELQRYELERDNLIRKNVLEINKKIIESHKTMLEICHLGKLQQQAKTELAAKTKETFKNVMKSNLSEEREWKNKKVNLEHQLQSFLQNYDQEIGERNQNLHERRNKLQQEKATLADWKQKYEIQEKIYNKIVEDKEAEEARIREEKLLLFMMNRSAVIIQRAYRRILSKRKGKKKGKGKKSKK